MGFVLEGSTGDVSDTATQLELERIDRALESAAESFKFLSETGITRYDSGNQTYDANNTLTLRHGLGGIPDGVRTLLVCTTPDLGYSVGDEVEMVATSYERIAAGDADQGISVVVTDTSFTVQFGKHATFSVAIISQADGTVAGATNTSWAYRIRAFRIR